MKYGIITFNRAYNYGAALQCYALSKVMQELEMDCEVIDYWPSYFYKYYHFKEGNGIAAVKYNIKRIFIKKNLDSRNHKFDFFLRKKVPLSKKQYRDQKDFSDEILKYDAIITGSDQVWNPELTGFDRVFFLGLPLMKKTDKYTYAVSLGMPNIPSDLKEEFADRLSEFRYLSVRESSAADMLEAIGCRNVEVVCDPTLLLPLNRWNKLAEKKGYDKFILMYYTVWSESLRKTARALADLKNLKVISLPCHISFHALSGKSDKEDGFELHGDCGPEEFLGLFKNAEYVVTNTFHGTIFSLIFHKTFIAQCQNDWGKDNIRILELLNEFNLTERNGINVDDIDKNISWEMVDKKIIELREQGMNYLLKIRDDVESRN